jgi:hypothetical protein
MGRIKSAIIVTTVCFALLGFVVTEIFAGEIKEITLPINGGVYRMITSPVLPEDPDPQVSLADDLGQYDKSQWRFFRWDAVDSKYIELKTPDWDPMRHDFDFGRGYWIISRNPTEVDIQGNPTGVDQIELEGMPGRELWNQIGSIYLQDFTIDMFPNCNLWVTPKSGGISFQLNDPLNPYTHVTLKEYIGGVSYTNIGDELGEILEAGKGYWLKNIWDENIILSFDPAGLGQVPTTADLPGPEFFARVAQQDDPPDPPPAIESSASASFASGSGGGGGGGCFIATAAYGNYDDPGVQLLREFRDRYLLKNRFGRFFVDTYYRYSPGLAGLVAKHKPIGALVRCNLMPLIGVSAVVSKMNAYAFLVLIGFLLLAGLFSVKRTKGAWGRCKPKLSRELKERKREK